MIYILKKKTHKTEKLNLKLVKQIFKSNLNDQNSNNTKSHERLKRRKPILRKSLKFFSGTKRLHEKLQAVVVPSSNDISENEKITRKLRKRYHYKK